MSILKPRNRLVNFRLTEEEFVHLRDACVAQGARSISDFARSAVLRQAENPSANSANDRPSTQSLAELHLMMATLEARMGKLGQQVDAVTPVAAGQLT